MLWIVLVARAPCVAVLRAIVMVVCARGASCSGRTFDFFLRSLHPPDVASTWPRPPPPRPTPLTAGTAAVRIHVRVSWLVCAAAHNRTRPKGGLLTQHSVPLTPLQQLHRNRLAVAATGGSRTRMASKRERDFHMDPACHVTRVETTCERPCPVAHTDGVTHRRRPCVLRLSVSRSRTHHSSLHDHPPVPPVT